MDFIINFSNYILIAYTWSLPRRRREGWRQLCWRQEVEGRVFPSGQDAHTVKLSSIIPDFYIPSNNK
jgi:hypothetical protein